MFGVRHSLVTLHDPVFGPLTGAPTHGWTNEASLALGPRPIQLVIAAPASGPTEAQRSEFLMLKDASCGRLAAATQAVLDLRSSMGLSQTAVWLSGVSVPERSGAQPALWTLWFDSNDDDVFMFGVQTDDWVTFRAFADD